MSSQFQTGQVLFADQTTKIRVVKIPITFTTGVITRDFLQELGMQMVRLEINNRDALADVLVRTEPFQEPPERIPPNTRGELTDEVHSFLQITPNAVSGIGDAFAYVAPTAELVRMGLIAS